tara:strand:+ start:20318 stop:20530 length:213 start_codon:yes stop_codon:yes gene_type:complete
MNSVRRAKERRSCSLVERARGKAIMLITTLKVTNVNTTVSSSRRISEAGSRRVDFHHLAARHGAHDVAHE